MYLDSDPSYRLAYAQAPCLKRPGSNFSETSKYESGQSDQHVANSDLKMRSGGHKFQGDGHQPNGCHVRSQASPLGQNRQAYDHLDHANDVHEYLSTEGQDKAIGPKYDGQLASKLKNLSSPARNEANPSPIRSIHHARSSLPLN